MCPSVGLSVLQDPTNGEEMPHPGRGGHFAMLSNITEEMPFELKVLEVVLDFVTTYMEFLTSDLEASAHPALDAIVQRVRALTYTRSPKTQALSPNF